MDMFNLWIHFLLSLYSACSAISSAGCHLDVLVHQVLVGRSSHGGTDTRGPSSRKLQSARCFCACIAPSVCNNSLCRWSCTATGALGKYLHGAVLWRILGAITAKAVAWNVNHRRNIKVLLIRGCSNHFGY